MDPTSLPAATSQRPVWVVFPAAIALLAYSAATMAAGYGGAAGFYSLVNNWNRQPVEPSSHAQNVEIPEELPPPFLDWPQEAPSVALVISGQMNGYMRPCGCSAGQHGGLARRAGFIDFLQKEKKWPTLPVDLGDLVDHSGEMATLKYRYTLRSLAKMGYPVVGVGPGDLKLQVIDLLGETLNISEPKPVLANLEHELYKAALAESDQWFKRVAVQKQGDMNVAVSVLMAPTDTPMEAGASLTPPAEITDEILKEMAEKEAGLKVLLAHMPFADAKQFAEKHPGFDLIVSRSEYEDSASREATMVGDTMVTWVGKKGKAVGVVGFWKDQQPRLRFEMVAMDPRFEEVESVNDVYAQFVADVKQQQLLKQVPKLPLKHEDDFYVGAQRCGECHIPIYQKWKATKHAEAMHTLTHAKPAGQDYNPECVQCHVVGLRSQTGFASLDETPHLAGVQCESCHGPGGKHSDASMNMEYRARVRVSRLTAKQDCVKCHDSENSVHFNFETYWPKVAHP